MDDLNYRNIFPNNNIPKIKVRIKEQSFEEKLSNEIKSVLNYASMSELKKRIKSLELKVQVQKDPASALLEKLKEVAENKGELQN
jgi:hypothetical protein